MVDDVDLAGVIARIAAANSADPECDDLTVPLAVELADAQSRITSLESELADRERQIVDAWNAFGPPSTRGGKICELYGDIDVLMLAGGADLAGNILELEDQLAAKDAENARLLTVNARQASALEDARKTMRNAKGAIESYQVVDKDVHGMMRKGIERIDAALAEHEQAVTGEQMIAVPISDLRHALDIAARNEHAPSVIRLGVLLNASPGKGAE